MTSYTNTRPLETGPGAGITAGTGTICETSVYDAGDYLETKIFVDLTGLHETGAGDIIGVDGTANPCYLCQVTANECGTIASVKMECLEAPATGGADIDLHSATEATGVEDAAISSLTNTEIINAGASTLGSVDYAQTIAADQYLYLVCQSAGDATYTAGKLLITLIGTK